VPALIVAALAATTTFAGPAQGDKSKWSKGSKDVIWLEHAEVVLAAAAALDQGDAAKAIELSKAALDLNLGPLDQEMTFNTLCVAHTFTREFKTAIKYCDRLVEMAEPNWTYLNNRANAYLQSGRIADAIDDYQAALQLVETINANAEERALGEPDPVKVAGILRRNLDLARGRQAAGLEGVPVGADGPQS